MSTEFVATLTEGAYFIHNGASYAAVQEATTSVWLSTTHENNQAGQERTGGGYFWVYRSGYRFDISDLPADANLTGATLEFYALGKGNVDIDLTIVEVDLSAPPVNSDYSKLLTTSFGTFDTAGLVNDDYNTINFNAAGLVYLNAAISSGILELGLRGDTDISATQPANLNDTEYVLWESATETNIPILTLTYSTWPDLYPVSPVFPVTGKIDLATYSVIRDQLTGLDTDMSLLADSDGNIDLTVANWITWDGTSEKIAYASSTQRVTVSTLEATSAITIAADLVTIDPTITTTGTAVDCTVANDAQLSTTAYASIQSKITDNEVVFSASGAPTPADDWGYLYMDSSSGDFVMRTRDDGQAGTKTDILGDFSAM